MLKHWLSVVILLFPVMTFGWLISSVFIWKLIPTLSWIQGLAIAACVTATDPVLASAVVGKGKFAKRVPGHLRNILSAESACNDGMAFPFAYLALNIIRHTGHSGEIAFDFIVITVLYECVFGCILGAVIGYTGRHLIKFAEKKNLIDRESFLVFYFVLALFCTGVGSIIGVDDLLVAFAAGTAFSWDGWFARKTEESHVSNVIDLLLNMAYFVYFGAIIPWNNFNNASLGIEAWKLVILGILVLIFRRLPIVLAMKPFTPDIRTWREALFCGHFGPIGVGAVFISILVRAELEHGEPTPLAELPPEGSPNYFAIATIWPITTFLVICSIIVHGSSIAVFTLGKRLNNMTITMSYTTGGNNQSWLSRLPRIEGGRTLSLHKVDTDEPGRFKYGTTAKPAGGMKRRKKGEKDKRKEPPENLPIDLGAGKTIPEKVAQEPGEATAEERINQDEINAYEEGQHIIIEDNEGEVLATVHSKKGSTESDESTKGKGGKVDIEGTTPTQPQSPTSTAHSPTSTTPHKPIDEKAAHAARTHLDDDEKNRKSESPTPGQRLRNRSRSQNSGKGGRKVIAYQLDDDVIVENEDGEIIRRYKINRKHEATAEERHHHQQPRQRQGSIFDRTMSIIGLAKYVHTGGAGNLGSSSSRTPNRSTPDLEKQNTEDIIPVEAHPEEEKFPFDDETIRQHLKGLLHTGDLRPHHTSEAHDASHLGVPDRTRKEDEERSLSPTARQDHHAHATSSSSLSKETFPRNFLGRRHHADDEEDDDEEEEIVHHKPTATHREEEEETEVERKRRLAALGLLTTEGDDDDDEEDGLYTRRGSRLSPAPHMIQEEDEEEEEEPNNGSSSSEPPKIQWRDDVKRGRTRQ